MTLSIRVLKMDLLKKKLDALPATLQARIHNALAEGAEEVVATAKALVPVDHGVLKQSITWAWGAQNLQRKGGKRSTGYGLFGAINRGANEPQMIVSIGADATYLKINGRPIQLPRWIEFGTQAQAKGEKVVNLDHRGRVTRVRRSRVKSTYAGMPPRPFLLPAFRINKKRISARVSKAVRDALAMVARKG